MLKKGDSKLLSIIFAVFDSFMWKQCKKQDPREYPGLIRTHKVKPADPPKEEVKQPPISGDLSEERKQVRSDSPLKGIAIEKSQCMPSDMSPKKDTGPNPGEVVVNTGFSAEADTIVGMCVYWMLTFDFSGIPRAKEASIVGKLRELSLAGSIRKRIRLCNEMLVEQTLLQYIFLDYDDDKCPLILGNMSYAALISAALGLVVDAWSEDAQPRLSLPEHCAKNKHSQLMRSGMNIADLRIKQPLVMRFLLGNHKSLTEDARQSLAEDLTLLTGEPRLKKELLDLSQESSITELIVRCHQKEADLATMMLSMLRDPTKAPEMREMCRELSSRSVQSRIMVIGECLTRCFAGNPKKNSTNTAGIVYMLHVVDDAAVQDPSVLAGEEMRRIVCQFLCLLTKHKMLYISCLPPTQPALEFSTSASSPRPYNRHEGGVLRVMLRLLPLLVKHDNGSGFSVNLLRYYVLGDPESYHRILTEVMKPPVDIHPKRVSEYNLLDIAFRGIPKKLELHEQAVKCFAAPGQNVTETLPGFVFLYLLGSMWQLVHFGIFGIKRYDQLPPTKERNKIINDPDLTKSLPPKLQQLAQLIVDVLVYEYFQPGIAGDLGTAITETLNVLRSVAPRVRANFDPRLGSEDIYSPLDEISEEAKEEEKEGAILDKSDHNVSKWLNDNMIALKEYILSFVVTSTAIKKDKANLAELTRRVVIYTLPSRCLDQAQPCVLLLTASNFRPKEFPKPRNNSSGFDVSVVSHKSEPSVARSSSIFSSFKSLFCADSTKSAEELRARVRNRFVKITIPIRKLGMASALCYMG